MAGINPKGPIGSGGLTPTPWQGSTFSGPTLDLSQQYRNGAQPDPNAPVMWMGEKIPAPTASEPAPSSSPAPAPSPAMAGLAAAAPAPAASAAPSGGGADVGAVAVPKSTAAGLPATNFDGGETADTQWLQSPMSLRQGIGNRTPPSYNALLAGLSRAY